MISIMFFTPVLGTPYEFTVKKLQNFNSVMLVVHLVGQKVET
jgi:hypothetical protein